MKDDKISKMSSIQDKLRFLSDDSSIFIKHPAVLKLFDEFEYLIKIGKSNGCRGIIVAGHSGAGKTTACFKFREKYPKRHESEREVFEVLYVNCPARPTVKGVMSKILESFDAPGYDRGTTNQMEARIKHYIANCGTKLMIIDEVQHLLDERSESSISGPGKVTLNLLKNISNETITNIALVGNENSDNILAADFQVRRRFRKVFHLPLFAEGVNFQSLIKSIEEVLPLKPHSNLAKPEMAHLLWNITGGVISEVMMLLKEAAREAIKDGSEIITKPLLEKCRDNIMVLKEDDLTTLKLQKAY